MDQHEQIKDVDENSPRHDWKEDLNIVQEYTEYRQNVIKMLGDFEIMWDGQLGRINVAKDRI